MLTTAAAAWRRWEADPRAHRAGARTEFAVACIALIPLFWSLILVQLSFFNRLQHEKKF